MFPAATKDPYLLPDDGCFDLWAVSRVVGGELAMDGQPTKLTARERMTAITTLSSLGWDRNQINDHLHEYAGMPRDWWEVLR